MATAEAHIDLGKPIRLLVHQAVAESIAQKLEALTVGPDDRLVLTFPGNVPDGDRRLMWEAISGTGLDGRVLLVFGAEHVALIRCTCPDVRALDGSQPSDRPIDPGCPIHGGR